MIKNLYFTVLTYGRTQFSVYIYATNSHDAAQDTIEIARILHGYCHNKFADCLN